MASHPDLQELYKKFDGTGDSNARLAWYGQCRAEGMSHAEAIVATAAKYKYWVKEVWPKRDIEITPDVQKAMDEYRAW